uniref:Serine/threonine protein phosphatase 7 long form isogeny n=1 Tax=Cajanus cajan TaxID=3821 RepID=A0A151RBX3_CAJCA|nr:Serine/threonine protein phosphatase 7 long form isogeny [Cajanus cajan]
MLGVTEMSYFFIDHHLISALVEQWRLKTHIFHMTFGKCTITLEDVSILFGLKVHGDPITDCSTYRWIPLVQDLLGITPPPNAIKGGWLKIMEQYTRAYILQLLKSMFFSYKSSTLISMRYLVMLTDLDQCGQLSWRLIVLANLYRELCIGSNYD